MNLTNEQYAMLRRRLAKLRNDAQGKVRETLPPPADEKSLAHAGMALDEGDESVESYEEGLSHSLHEHYLASVRQIDAAQERAERGEISRCLSCGGEIGFERLIAHPLAVRCIICQSRHEKLHRDGLTQKL